MELLSRSLLLCWRVHLSLLIPNMNVVGKGRGRPAVAWETTQNQISEKFRSNLSKADTSLKRTKVFVPQVSALGRFYCTIKIAEVWADICCLVLSICVFVYVHVFYIFNFIMVCTCNFYFHANIKKNKKKTSSITLVCKLFLNKYGKKYYHLQKW